MNLQVALPYTTMCVYNCKFCCNTLHTQYKGEVLPPLEYTAALVNELLANEYDSLVITGENEPLQQWDYVLSILMKVPSKQHIELTTRGYKLDKLIKGYPDVLSRLNVINFSVVNDGHQGETMWFDKQMRMAKACHDLGITVRMTFIMTKFLSPHQVREVIATDYVDQITLKELQGDTTWIKKNRSVEVYRILLNEAQTIKRGTRFNKLHIGSRVIWVDYDCQSGNGYHILRPDGKLYDSWTSKTPMKEQSK